MNVLFVLSQNILLVNIYSNWMIRVIKNMYKQRILIKILANNKSLMALISAISTLFVVLFKRTIECQIMLL